MGINFNRGETSDWPQLQPTAQEYEEAGQLRMQPFTNQPFPEILDPREVSLDLDPTIEPDNL